MMKLNWYHEKVCDSISNALLHLVKQLELVAEHVAYSYSYMLVHVIDTIYVPQLQSKTFGFVCSESRRTLLRSICKAVQVERRRALDHHAYAGNVYCSFRRDGGRRVMLRSDMKYDARLPSPSLEHGPLCMERVDSSIWRTALEQCWP